MFCRISSHSQSSIRHSSYYTSNIDIAVVTPPAPKALLSLAEFLLDDSSKKSDDDELALVLLLSLLQLLLLLPLPLPLLSDEDSETLSFVHSIDCFSLCLASLTTKHFDTTAAAITEVATSPTFSTASLTVITCRGGTVCAFREFSM
jgi:hypothetical protein